MWQSPNQRVRAIAAQRQKERLRLMQPFHIRRIIGDVEILATNVTEASQAQCRVVLNELTPKGMAIYLKEPLVTGQELIVTLMEPTPIQLRGKVVSCLTTYNESHIMRDEFPSRITMFFSFKTEGEKKMVQDFYDSLNSTYLYGKAA